MYGRRRRTSYSRSRSRRSYGRRRTYGRLRRGPARSYRRRNRRMRSSTKVITFSVEGLIGIPSSSPKSTGPFAFKIQDLPGFFQWQQVMSQYKVLSATIILQNSLTRSVTTPMMPKFMVAPSYNLARFRSDAQADGLPNLAETDIRQLAKVSIINPSTTQTSYRYTFKPYQLMGRYAVAFGAQIGNFWDYYPSYNWQPLGLPSTSEIGENAICIGPYIWNQEWNASEPTEFPYTLKVRVAFKGPQ